MSSVSTAGCWYYRCIFTVITTFLMMSSVTRYFGVKATLLATEVQSTPPPPAVHTLGSRYESFSILTGTNFSKVWTVQADGVFEYHYGVKPPRLYMKKPCPSFVPYSKTDDNIDYPFSVIFAIGGEDVCPGAYYTVGHPSKEFVDTKYTRYFDVVFVIPNVSLSCEGEFKLEIDSSGDRVDSKLQLFIQQKAFFRYGLMNYSATNESRVSFAVEPVGTPKPEVKWFCLKTVLDSQSEEPLYELFEFESFRNHTVLKASADFLPYHQCTNLICYISNRVCLGKHMNINGTAREPQLQCFNNSVNLTTRRSTPSSAFAQPLKTSASNTGSSSLCQDLVDVRCQNVFTHYPFVHKKVQRSILNLADDLIYQHHNKVTPLCQVLIKNFTCSYTFSDSYCLNRAKISEDVKVLNEKTEDRTSNRVLVGKENGFSCLDNLKIIKTHCPRVLWHNLFFEWTLVDESCEPNYLFTQQFPIMSCRPTQNINYWRYSGRHNRTIKSNTCMPWKDVPQHLLNDIRDPDFLHASFTSNECRHVLKYNLTHPGCFVQYYPGGYFGQNDAKVKFEVCDVPLCGAAGTSAESQQSGNHEVPFVKLEMSDSSTIFIPSTFQSLIILSIVASLLIIVCVLGGVYYYRKASKQLAIMEPLSPDYFDRGSIRLHPNPKYNDSSSTTGGTVSPNPTMSCNLLSSVISRQPSLSHSTNSQFNRYSLQSNHTNHRHDSFTSQSGSDKPSVTALRSSPSASEFFTSAIGTLGRGTNGSFEQQGTLGFNSLGRNRMRQIDPRLEYDRNSIQYINDLGMGAFGQVFHAKVPDKNNPQKYLEVAVKMLKDGHSAETKKAFQQEALILANFSHPNIVKLRGVCSKGSPFCMLMDYMKYGDLHRYLGSCAGNDSMTRPTLNVTDLLMISQHVASGMAYVSEKNYIHRDLATRNCLVGESLVVKITDFGLSVQVKDNCDHIFLQVSDGVVPMRWMAPEALTQGRYSRQSDVWSFGVLLWEVFTFGMQPYYNKNNESIVSYVTSGGVLEREINCNTMCEIPEDVYCEIMLHCWHLQPSKRPSFRSIYESLDSLLKKYTAASSCPPSASFQSLNSRANNSSCNFLNSQPTGTAPEVPLGAVSVGSLTLNRQHSLYAAPCPYVAPPQRRTYSHSQAHSFC